MTHRITSPLRLALQCVAVCAVLFIVSLSGCGARDFHPVERAGNSEEAIHFTNGEISLAGTLVIPSGSQKYPAVVLFHGSGPQSRNLFLARWFADHGFAALTYDKRGVGESTGNFRVVPFMDLCADGLAAIAYLKSRKEIDSKHIGVWGLSQGGWLGPLAASRSSDVAFVIDVSGPAVSPGEQMLFYYAEDLEAKGVSATDIRDATALRRGIWNYLSTGNGYPEVEAQMKQDRGKPWYNVVKAQQDNLFEGIHPPSANDHKPSSKFDWFKQEMNYDPVPALESLKVPTLFIFGDEDRLVPVPRTIEIIRNVLARNTAHDFTIQILHQADHGMYLPTGNLAPEYLETMQKWLAARANGLLGIRR